MRGLLILFDAIDEDELYGSLINVSKSLEEEFTTTGRLLLTLGIIKVYHVTDKQK